MLCLSRFDDGCKGDGGFYGASFWDWIPQDAEGIRGQKDITTFMGFLVDPLGGFGFYFETVHVYPTQEFAIIPQHHF